MGQPVSLLELFESHAQGQREDIHTAMPAQVQSYDSSKRTCTVQPTVRLPVFNVDGTLDQTYELPVIADVPVAFFRGGGFFFAWDLKQGDTVFLVFSESAMGQWRSSGGVTDPVDVARHSLGYPVAFPVVSPDTMPFVDGQSGKLVMGKEGDDAQIVLGAGAIQIGKMASDFAALSSKVDAALSKIQSTFDNHTHNGLSLAVSTTGTATAQSGTATGATPTPSSTIGSIATVAAAITKVE